MRGANGSTPPESAGRENGIAGFAPVLGSAALTRRALWRVHDPDGFAVRCG
jgi:hypothetical protein